MLFRSVDAVEENIIQKGERVIKQGENGDFMYVIESGALECLILKDGSEVVVKTCEAGDAFGELALLYNAPRAASVQAKDRCVCCDCCDPPLTPREKPAWLCSFSSVSSVGWTSALTMPFLS